MSRSLLLFLGFAALSLGAAPDSGRLTVTARSCDESSDPLGIDNPQPQLSWRLASAVRGEYQTAYQVQVSSDEAFPASGHADLWDTGKVASGQSIALPYGGSPLRSRERCFWRVRVWDRDGRPSPYSPVGTWEMGLLHPEDWSAGWISFTEGWEGRALYFRRAFSVKRPVRRARAFISGLGYSELHLNGAKVGNHVLDPAQSDYGKRVLYLTYDVGDRLRVGPNVVGAVVGAGWYGMPKLKMQLEIVYDDGTTEVVATQGGSNLLPLVWQVGGGPILRNGVYDGETYDARLEKAGWDRPFPGGIAPLSPDRMEDWTTADEIDGPSGRLEAQTEEPIRVMERFHPVALAEPRPGVWVFDSGQNLTGWCGLKVAGPRGSRVTLRFAENLNADGTVNQENLRTADAVDVYILKGGGMEIWEPHFTYHGFRYVQVEGFPGKPTPESLRIKRLRSAVATSGAFVCGDDELNRIHRMVAATEAGNLYGIPIACPQRNERQAWLNDMTVREEEGVYNFNLARMYDKWIDDVEDTQDAAGAIADTAPYKWGKRPADPVCASYILLAWLSYQHYGDVAIIRNHYASFNRWINYLLSRTDHGIVTFSSWGDWSPPRAFAVPGSIGSGSISAGTPGRLMSTGMLFYQIRLLRQMAAVLGRDDEARRLDGLAARTAEAFNSRYWDEAAGGYGSNNQACNALALFLGVVSPERKARVLDNLVRAVERNGGHLSTGNICTKYLLEVLAENGRADVAYRVASMRTYPSWGFMVDNGATTLWERWEHLTGRGMNSHSHPMFGSVGSWFYKYLGGIQKDGMSPGFQRFVIRPSILGPVAWVRCSYESPYGRIASDWRLDGSRLTMKVSVPVNATALVHVPAASADAVTEGGVPVARAAAVKGVASAAGESIFELGSGDYEFVSRLPSPPSAGR